MTDNPVLLPAEAAAFFRLTTRRFLRAVNAGELPRGMTVGGALRWYRPALEDWLANGAPPSRQPLCQRHGEAGHPVLPAVAIDVARHLDAAVAHVPLSDLYSADAAASDRGKLTDPRIAALAEVLRHNPLPLRPDGGTSRGRPAYRNDYEAQAAAILAALPVDWCGHDEAEYYRGRNCELEEEAANLARLRRIEEAARALMRQVPDGLYRFDALRAALEAER